MFKTDLEILEHMVSKPFNRASIARSTGIPPTSLHRIWSGETTLDKVSARHVEKLVQYFVDEEKERINVWIAQQRQYPAFSFEAILIAYIRHVANIQPIDENLLPVIQTTQGLYYFIELCAQEQMKKVTMPEEVDQEVI